MAPDATGQEGWRRFETRLGQVTEVHGWKPVEEIMQEMGFRLVEERRVYRSSEDLSITIAVKVDQQITTES